MTSHRIIQGDCIEGLRTLPDASVHCCVTSPPYWGLRDYGHDGQIGLEATPEAYVARMVAVFREVRRVLRDDGTCWVNLGDSYAAGPMSKAESTGRRSGGTLNGRRGYADNVCNSQRRSPVPESLKPKDLVGIPWRVAFALQADGWWLRQDIIWHKPNPMPESVRDRCTKAHEYVFLLTKSERYYYDAEAVSEAAAQSSGWAKQRAKGEDTWKYGRAAGGDPNSTNGVGGTLALGATRNRRSVWTVTTKPYSGAHFAVMPPDLVEPCIKAGCPEQCCSVCGAPLSPILERQPGDTEAAMRPKKTGGMASTTSTLSLSGNGSVEWAKRGGKTSVVGWAPACDCAASDTIPGTVLDPFAGSGTTLAVAAELGRSGIGCELNPEYIELAEQRIAKSKAKMPLFVA
jgi:DNA modification methylase